MHTANPDVRTARTPPVENSASTQRVETTPFVDAFTREFIRPDPNQRRIWPGGKDVATFCTEFGAFLETLLLAESSRELPTNTGDEFRDRIANFLNGRWPIGTEGLPEAWKKAPQAGRYAEISLVCQALLTAVLNRGGGGGESTIPPHGR